MNSFEIFLCIFGYIGIGWGTVYLVMGLAETEGSCLERLFFFLFWPLFYVVMILFTVLAVVAGIFL